MIINHVVNDINTLLDEVIYMAGTSIKVKHREITTCDICDEVHYLDEFDPSWAVEGCPACKDM